jgi:hypothetical protein
MPFLDNVRAVLYISSQSREGKFNVKTAPPTADSKGP